MAFTRPSKYPEWASNPNIIDPVSNVNNIVEPDNNLKVEGWWRNVKPPRQFQNWLANLYYNWIGYLDESLTNLTSTVNNLVNVVLDLDTDDIENNSNVVGASTSDALNNIHDSLLILSNNGIMSTTLIEGVTANNNTTTYIDLPSGYTTNNTIILSSQIEYDGIFRWDSMPVNDCIVSIDMLQSTPQLIINVPIASSYANGKKFKIVIMKID